MSRRTPEFSATPDISGNILIGEPAMRPDGRVVRLYKTNDGLILRLDGNWSYKDEEVALLGDGDWSVGFIRIAQVGYSYQMHCETMLSLLRPLHDELPVLGG